MIKKLKLSTVITGVVSFVVAVCILLLFLLSNNSMMEAMKETSMNNMKTSLEAKTQTIDEYVMLNFRKRYRIIQFNTMMGWNNGKVYIYVTGIHMYLPIPIRMQ